MLNKFQKKIIKPHEFVSEVCNYFDVMKDVELSEADKKLLIFLSNKAGIPHYYDMLENFKEKKDLSISNVDFNTFSSLLYETTLHTDEKSKIHRYQKEVLEKFEIGKQNRYFLSATTSFGKTFLAYETIKKMKYRNILLVFPTIALLSENLERIKENEAYVYFQENYEIHTLSELEDNYKEKNIFIYTPERFLSFMDKNSGKINFDFAFIDEIYKIDNEYLIDEELKENERDLAYRLALFYSLTKNKNIDVLLAGPYISFYSKNKPNYNPSFDYFLKDFGINLINKNEYEIVNRTITNIKKARIVHVPGFTDINFIDNKGNNLEKKQDRLNIILQEIFKQTLLEQNTIIYCYSKPSVEITSKHIIISNLLKEHDYSSYKELIEHIENKYNKKWIVVKALKRGIGIHHGAVPKYIQKEIINLFGKKEQGIRILISTTTITEGVNTSAKNLIVLHHSKGDKLLKTFDAKNIIGRAGRFSQHYSGRVFSLLNDFKKILEKEEEGIKHKNYDRNVQKDDVDTEITKDEYLTEKNKLKRAEIMEKQNKRHIPENIISQFKVVSREDKIKIYDAIKRLSNVEHDHILELIKKTNYKDPQIDYDGFQIIIQILEPIVKNKKLLWLFGKSDWNRQKLDDYSRLTHKLYHYLKSGFIGAFNFNKDVRGMDIDKSMREASEFIYNTLKYQLVKYLGVFNLMYKFERSQALGIEFDEINGIDRLLAKLEYNAFSPEARLASDYGVPYSIIQYYDAEPENRNEIKFDNYEKSIFNKFNKLISKN